MIYDCHTHIGRNKHINSSIKDLLNSMDRANISKSLVFAGKLNDVDNEYLLKEIKNHRDRLYAVAAFHPYDTEIETSILKKCIEERQFVAVKFYLGYDHWYPNDSRIYEMLNFINEHKVAAIFHCGDCLNSVKAAKLKYSHPLNIDDPATDFPNINFIIAHMGNPWILDTAQVCYKNDNVYTDISGYVYNNFSEEMKKCFHEDISHFLKICSKPEKLLFGTDFPISNQKSYVETINDYFCQYGQINPELMTDNVKKAFNLNK